MPRPLLVVSLTAALACGEVDDSQPVVDFAEVCGHAGPVRLLGLPPGSKLVRGSAPLRVDGRQYFLTSRSPKSTLIDRDNEVWSTGPCGESPRHLADDVRWLSTQRERWPGVTLACLDAGQTIVALDPDGGPMVPLLPDANCDGFWSDHGVVVRDPHLDPNGNGSFTALVLYPYPSDPRAPADPPIVLHPAVRQAPAIADDRIGSLVRTRLNEVFALDDENNLLRFDLADRSVTVVAAGVLNFRVSLDDGRYVLWQALAAPGPDPYGTESPVLLLDRSTGASVSLGTAALAHTPDAAYHVAEGLILLWSVPAILRVFRLPDLTPFDLPQSYDLAGVIDAHRVLISAPMIGPLLIYDSATGEQTPLVLAVGEVFDFTPERALFRARADTPEDRLFRVPLPRGEVRLVAPRVSQYARLLDDTRLITPVAGDGVEPDALLLVDLNTATEYTLDRGVIAESIVLDAGYGPDHVVYAIDDGDRSGIYVARLPGR